ncbi:hypothetical protein B425_0227 [Bacillus amyloliquefaciens]|nr:hypothetical protein B425_0227 [Bacillus amyloliquefaciens]
MPAFHTSLKICLVLVVHCFPTFCEGRSNKKSHAGEWHEIPANRLFE